MEKKQYFNLNNLRANDSRTIIDKQWYHSEEEDPEFNRCDSPEDKSRIRHEAKYIYKQLLSSPDNRCVRTIDSEIIRVNYYAVTFDSVKTTPDGRVFNETADAIDYDFAYNPYYYKKDTAGFRKQYTTSLMGTDSVAEWNMMGPDNVKVAKWINEICIDI